MPKRAMTQKEREAVSQRMTRYWAKRRREKKAAARTATRQARHASNGLVLEREVPVASLRKLTEKTLRAYTVLGASVRLQQIAQEAAMLTKQFPELRREKP